jgi:hypothetical protein
MIASLEVQVYPFKKRTAGLSLEKKDCRFSIFVGH